MAKVLVVTDYAGRLHITPAGNKAYYQAQNQRNKLQQYTFREMEGDSKGDQPSEAEQFVAKNFGIDPSFKTPKQAAEVIADKDAEIRALREQLQAAQKASPEIQKQRDVLNELSTTPTSDSPYSEKAAEEIKDAPKPGKK
jgi:hypothetical protein